MNGVDKRISELILATAVAYCMADSCIDEILSLNPDIDDKELGEAIGYAMSIIPKPRKKERSKCSTE